MKKKKKILLNFLPFLLYFNNFMIKIKNLIEKNFTIQIWHLVRLLRHLNTYHQKKDIFL